jgi:biotin carboxyl carrier protein
MDVDINGTRRQVVLRRDGGAWVARIDGRDPLHVDLRRAGDGWSLLVGIAAADAAAGPVFRSYDVAVEHFRHGELIVYVDGQAFTGGLPQLQRYTARESSAVPAGPGGERPIVAPMPGRVVKVLVSAGEPVRARQPLVVVEAMKMENELRAPHAGTVTRVAVAAGSPVEAGQVLLVVTQA